MASELGRLIAVLRLLHEVLGVASLESGDPATTCSLDEYSMRHSHQAELLIDHLPRRDGVERAALIDLGSLLGLDDVLRARFSAPELLLAAHEEVVLAWLVRNVDRMIAQTSDAAERSLRRSLRFVAADLSAGPASWRQGDVLPGPGSLLDPMAELSAVLSRGEFD